MPTKGVAVGITLDFQAYNSNWLIVSHNPCIASIPMPCWKQHTNTKLMLAITPGGPQKLAHPIITQICGLCQPHSWMVSCPTVHSDDKPVSSGNQCTYIGTNYDVHKVACSGESYFSQRTPYRISNTNSN